VPVAGLAVFGEEGLGGAGWAGIVAGVLGLAVGFALWWIYFDFVARRAPKPVFATALFWV